MFIIVSRAWPYKLDERIPVTMPASVSRMVGSIGVAPRLTRSGPGQNPVAPQPMPKMAEPTISRASILPPDGAIACGTFM
eukprot:scaffold3602_cov33-Tisochrysis_lutea.AAC.2